MDEKFLSDCLQRMNCYTSKCTRETVETLLTIHRNILFKKEDPKFRKIKLDNSGFRSKVWNKGPAQSFMMACGWTQIDNALFFHADENLVRIIDILLGHRFVAPETAEWKEETKLENLNVSKQHEEKLRRKAALERQKELDEYNEEKKYREQLNQNIKKQIADDKKRRQEKLYTRPVVGNRLDRRMNRRPPTPTRVDHLTNPDHVSPNCRRLND